ncbi:hypothetical protein [Riemerella columbina]|uniref:hypothetical protein n=1 Tax=Riemerella columbina TaxID=103810 RepID=UPI00266EE438|nr:hypothetical protein [Riemerella columbina]WKS94552.1 hypothetical protein NYR17_06335 [Riemerella columbina]
MKSLELKEMEKLKGMLKCSDKEGFIYGAMASGLLLAPVTMGGSFLMTAGAFVMSQVSAAYAIYSIM